MEQSLRAYEQHREVVLKRLVAGVDFAPPEPIASVLPRIQLTSSQADDLWALVCKGRRRNPNPNGAPVSCVVRPAIGGRRRAALAGAGPVIRTMMSPTSAEARFASAPSGKMWACSSLPYLRGLTMP